MKAITIQQIKAARALMNWSQTDLGERSGLSQTAIANIENGKHRASENTLQSFLQAFDKAGVEFIEGGVRLKPDSIEILEGDDCASRMPDIIFESMLRHDLDEYLVNGVDFGLIDQATHDSIKRQVSRLQQSGRKQRILVEEGTPREKIIGPLEWHRSLPSDIFSAATPSFIYNDCFAIMLLEKKQVIIIRNTSLADFQRRQFDWLWERAAPFSQ